MADTKRIIIKIDVSEKNAVKAVNTTKQSVDRLAASTQKLTKATTQQRAQSGLNNAILIETGRVASDASYGIQGIANNIGRLTELFQEFARTGGKGGVVGAFKELGKSLLGVGGIVVGFQLLLSFLPKIIKKFNELAGAATVLNDISKSVGENAQSLVGNFEIYSKTLLDSSETTEQHQIALKKLKDEYPDFNASILLDKENTEAANAARKEYIETLKKQAISQAALSKSQEIYGKIVEIEFNRELQLNKAKQDTNKARFIQGTAVMANMKNAEAEDALNERLLQNEVDRINKSADEAIKAESEKLDILFKLIDLEDKEKSKSAKKSKKAAEEKNKYDMLEVDNFDRKIKALKELGRLQAFFFNRNMQMDVAAEENSIIAINREREQNLARIDALKSMGLLEEELAIAKYEVNSYYNKLLAEEQEELDRRGFAMRLEMFGYYADALGSISQLFEENSKASKVFALAEIAANTAIGFAQGLTLAQQQAKEAAPVSALAFPVFYASQIAAVLAAAARAKSILSGGTPSRGGVAGARQVEAPDFNVVGASPESQLAQSVAGQQNQPLRAFVVGKEITTQQEFDRNIVTNASL